MWGRLKRRLRALVRKDEMERELDEELRHHLERQIELNVTAGMNLEEARYAALRSFGGVERAKQECREARGVRLIEDVWQDVRYGVRILLKNPGFTLVAAVALTLGIGANTAIFSVVNAILLRPLPYENPERVVRIGGTNLRKGRALGTFSPQDFLDWRERSASFESMAAYDGWSPSLTGAGSEPERVEAARVSSGFFNVLKAAPALGRVFLPSEEQRGNHFSVILSHALWQRRFASNPGILGQGVTLNGQNYMVIGVMPATFATPKFSGGDFEQAELWVPFAPDLGQWSRDGRSVDAAIARLKPGASLEQAQAELSSIAAQLEQQYADTNAGIGVAAVSLHEQFVAAVRPALLVFLVAVGLVLLIACGNVANLLLARAAVRQKELAVRTALGASRQRIIRQLLTESVLLAALSGALGMLLAWWAVGVLTSLGSNFLPQLGGIEVDARVLGFTLAVSLLTGVVFGLAPALAASKPNLNETLKESGRSLTGGMNRRSVRGLLVISEVALSLLLLVGSGLLLKSFVRLQHVSPGFEARNILTMNVFLPGTRYPEDWQHAAFFDQVLGRLHTLPGVESASVVSNLPISGNFDQVGFYVEGQPVAERADIPDVERYMVDAGYFQTLGIPMSRGRSFNEGDKADALQVAIINERVAHRFWPGEDPIGKRVRTDPSRPWLTVVGVAGDVRHYGLETAPSMQLYLAHQQTPSQFMTFVVRGVNNSEAQTAAVRGQVWAVDKDQPVYNIRTMEHLLSESLAQRRFIMLLLGIFAGVALVLAVSGLYGVMSYAVAQRRHEIGIRMALGAGRMNVLWLILKQGMTLVLIGITIGLAASIVTMRTLTSLLYGVSATDALTFAGVSLLMITTALLACSIPARRATKVDPLVALRYE